MRTLAILFVAGLSACAADAPNPGLHSSDGTRGAIGKADLTSLAGICTEDTCGGKSDSSCWCDTLCTRFGDCCDNYEEICLDACDGNSEPVSLEPVDADTTAFVGLYNDGCPSGFENCVMTSIDFFALPECVEQPVDMAEVVEVLTGPQGADPDDGQFTDLDGVINFFNTSDNAAALFTELAESLDASVAEAWVISGQIPCHNCTQFSDFAVVRFDDGTVVQLVGEHGFDS